MRGALMERLERLEAVCRADTAATGETITARWLRETLGERPPNTLEEDAWALELWRKLDMHMTARDARCAN